MSAVQRSAKRGSWKWIALALVIAVCGLASVDASVMVITGTGPVTWNGDNFCFTVTVCNQDTSGSGAVLVRATGTANISGLTVTGGQDGGGGAQIAAGECRTFKVCGKLTGQSGTVTVKLTYVNNDGDIVNGSLAVPVNQPFIVDVDPVEPKPLEPKGE